MIRFLYLLSFCMLTLSNVIAQAGDEPSFKLKRIPNFIPASPNASGIAKLAEIDANAYSGGVNISIPFFTIPLKELSIPVNLGYSATGVKVNEHASSTGMGWNLSAGGVITRIVKGTPDDVVDGYGYTVPFRSGMVTVGHLIDLYVRDSLTAQERKDVEWSIANGAMDGEPDIYMYSFPGQSGRFFITPSGRIVPVPYTPIRITGNHLSGFVITDTYGNKHEFKTIEATLSWKNVANGETGRTATNVDADVTYNAWYLSKIVSSRKEEVTFEYTKDTITPNYQASQTIYYLAEPYYPTACDAPSPFMDEFTITTTNYQKIGQQKLQSIHFPTGMIAFNYLHKRTDLPGDSALTEVVVKRPDNSNVKKFNLYYTYYSNRLFLNQVQETNGIDSLMPYNITYTNPNALPQRNSFAQDHWGYYNGQTNNTGLISLENNELGPWGVTAPAVLGNANREPNSTTMKYGMIEALKYPTGGYTLFDFEPHWYYKAGLETFSDTTFNYQSKIVNLSGAPTGYATYSQPFTIDRKQWVTAGYNIYGNATKVRVLRVQGSTETEVFTMDGNYTAPKVGSHSFLAEPGTYKLKAFNYEEEFYARVSLSYKIIIGYTVKKERMGGGLRIKTITDYGQANHIAKKKYYYYKSSHQDSISSGILLEKPKLSYLTHIIKEVNCGQGNPNVASYPGETNATYYVKLSVPATSLNTSAGSFVTYNTVIVQDDTLHRNGYAVYNFRSIDTAEDQQFIGFPYTQSISKDYKRGQTTKEKIIAAEQNLLKETITVYSDSNYVLSNDREWMAPGLNVGYIEKHPRYPEYDLFGTKKYYLYSGYVNPRSISTTLYGNPGSPIVSKQDFYYGNRKKHLFLTQTVTVSSNGQKKFHYITYPLDYQSSGFIKGMIDSNAIALPIEEVTLVETGGTKFVTKGKNARYKTDFPTVIDTLFTLETATSIPQANYRFSNASPGNLPFPNSGTNAYLRDDRYKMEESILLTDEKGNINTLIGRDAINTTSLWGYGKTLPIAQVRNARANEVFVENFEDGNNWDSNLSAIDNSKSYSGKYAGKIDNSSVNKKSTSFNEWQSISLNQATKFRYSVWVYSNSPGVDIFLLFKKEGENNSFTYSDHITTNTTGKWVLLEKEVIVPADAVEFKVRLDNKGVGTIWFDDIRVHPSAALMETFTYDPLVGITSKTDSRNIITFYEYDSLGRLSLIRDHKKYIVKKFCYNYQGQPENCDTILSN